MCVGGTQGLGERTGKAGCANLLVAPGGNVTRTAKPGSVTAHTRVAYGSESARCISS